MLDGKGVFTTDTVSQIGKQTDHEKFAKGKIIKDWVALKYDNRYKLSTKESILKLSDTATSPAKAIALSLAKKDDAEYFDFDDGIMI